MRFSAQVLYRSYIDYAKAKGVEEPDHQSAANYRQRLKPTKRVSLSPKQKLAHTDVVDPIYQVRSLNDSKFTSGYIKKWGCHEKLFKPQTDEMRLKLDSHSTLPKSDQRRINHILERNV